MGEESEILERGAITFLFRPRVEEWHAGEAGDVQRLFVLLTPAANAFQRLIAIGRKRLPSTPHERFWGFVDLVLDPFDMNAALGAHTYGTKTRGVRHLPAARPLGAGKYSLEKHGDHTHLQWRLTEVSDDPIAAELGLESGGDYIVTVANPDPQAWGVAPDVEVQSILFDELEAHVALPALLPNELQRRFKGRRFAQLDESQWLEHPGTELVFIGAGDGANRG